MPTEEEMINGRPKVLVLLAAYNGMEWLEPQIRTILGQSKVEVELWVSIDVSTDGTEAWFDRLAERDKRVRLLPHGLRFGAAAPNFFRLIRDVDAKNFDFVAFADQDDIWSEEKLSRAAAVVRRRNCDVYSGDVLAFWPDGREKLVKKSYPQREWDYLFEAAGPGCTYVFRVECFLHLQRMVRDTGDAINEVIAHDWFCYAFARSEGYRWFIDSQPMMHYRQHAKNHLGANTGLRAFYMRLKMFLGGEWLYQVRLIAILLRLQDEAFFKPWQSPGKVKGYLFLASKSFSLRRRPRDAVLMGCMLVVMAISTLFQR